jgi:SapC
VIDTNLFTQPIALDRQAHRTKRLHAPAVRYDRTAKMNAMFIAVAEFGDVCREYPIVFVDAGPGAEGTREVAPMAVFGLTQGENLMLNADGSWGARYAPALLRGYPVGLARTGDDQYAVIVDGDANSLSDTEGERLFDDAGEPSELLNARRTFIEELERESQRTRAACQRLMALELLQPMRFDATLPDGKQLAVDGFLAVNEEKLAKLEDAVVLEMHRNGLMALIHAHQISLPLMRVLVERRLARAQ